MKKQSIITYIGILFLLPVFFSCEEPNMGKGVTYNKGLLNFFVSIPGESGEYGASNTGPYEDGDSLYIKVPSTEEAPLDLTRLKPYASLENNSEIVPGLPGIMDFTNPISIQVRDGQGITRTHIIKVIPTVPKTTFKSMWFKTAQELGITNTNIPGMTVIGDYLLVQDGSGSGVPGTRVYNKVTGEYIKVIAPPTTFTMQVTADDAGHFAVNRYNIYGAGFMLYYYEDINSSPKLILNYAAADGCPAELGWKVSIIGNLKEGLAYVYATTKNNMDYYYWKFVDGVPESKIPTVARYAAAKTPWTYAKVMRKDLSENSDHYITYCHYVSPDANLENGSRFEVFPPDMNLTQMNPKNHYYKILGFDVFTVNGDRFLAILEQGYTAWDATDIKVFEITNEGNLKMVPGDEGYSNFLLTASTAYGGTNYNRWGDVATIVIGNEVYIYATMATNAATTSGVIAYKMTYHPQN